MNWPIRKKKISKTNSSEGVGEFYDETTDKFLAVYGEIIQAFRTKNVYEYLDYTIRSIGLKSGMNVIDAGCGVCGPACYFAEKIADLHIDACSVSKVQIEKSIQKIKERNLNNNVYPKVADYHYLAENYESEKYDVVYFLESFGHSKNKYKVIDEVWSVLKPGGKLYIKDLFKRESFDEWEQLKIDNICNQINDAYQYEIGDIHEVFSYLRKKNFILKFIKIPDVDLDAFENLTISNDFQNLFNIGKINSWDQYIFPIDFYEILVQKPSFDLRENKHLFFMNQK